MSLPMQEGDVGPRDDLGDPISENNWQQFALCQDANKATADLFFSEKIDDIAAAKAFCQGCEVAHFCLSGALERREAWGVWGGELFVNGRPVAGNQRKGRPTKA